MASEATYIEDNAGNRLRVRDQLSAHQVASVWYCSDVPPGMAVGEALAPFAIEPECWDEGAENGYQLVGTIERQEWWTTRGTIAALDEMAATFVSHWRWVADEVLAEASRGAA
jgi:hypothetical protein